LAKRFARKFRFVSLHIDDHIHVELSRHFGHAVGAAGAVGAGHLHLSAKGPHLGGDLFVVGGHAHAARQPGPAGRFVGVLNQRLARLAQQQLAGQPRRGEPRGNDNEAGWIHP
jgi:hypothetical protein